MPCAVYVIVVAVFGVVELPLVEQVPDTDDAQLKAVPQPVTVN